MATPVQVFECIREVQVKISDQFQNDSLLCLDTITALGLQYVYVRKAGRFIGEFASEIIESREHYIHRNGGELSWEFLDEFSSVVAPCNIGILTFLKSHHCSFSDGSTYDSWKASTGKYSTSGGERHCDILSSPLDTSLTHIDFGGDLISFEVELACAPTLTPVNNGELRVPDPFADDFLSVNSSVRSRNDELLVDKFVSKTEVFFNHVCARLDQTEKSTSEGFDKMKTAMNEIQVVSAERFNQLEQKFDNKFIHLEQKFDNQFVHLEQKFDNQNEHFEQKFHSLTGQFDCLQQKFDRQTAKFDQFEKNTNDKFEQFQKSTDDKFDQFEISISREIDNKLEHIEATISDKIDTVISDKINDKLEQIEVTITEKIDTVISDKLESLISEKMQTEFNKFEEKVDLKFVNLRGELLQVDSKLNTLQLQLTDKMTTEMNKFQADIDNKFVHFNKELTDFKSTVTEQLDAKFKLVNDDFNALETNLLSRVDIFENSVNVRMDCIDDKINILNDKVDHIHDKVIKLDEKVDNLEIKVDINHAIVMDKVGALGHKLDSFIDDQTKFNVTVEQKMQVFDQNINDHDLAIKRIEKIADRHCEQILELHKMIDVRKAEIGNEFNRDMQSQSDQLNNKIDKLSETFTDKLNCEIDKVSETVKDRLNCQDDKVSKLDDAFSDLVQNTVASLKTEVKTIQHSVDSHSVDVSLCKSRLDVVDKNIVDVITKVDHVSIKVSNVHQIGKKSSLNENQQSTPILVSGNAAGEQIPSPGQRRVVDIVSRGVTQPRTDESWSRVNRTENDTTANPQSTPKQTQFNNTLDYLRNSEGKLITSGENMSFSGSRSHQNYRDNEAPQTIDFVNQGGPRRVMPVFDGTGDIDVFFKKFESIVTACEWPEYETISRLMTDCLQGEAASILLTVPSDFIMTYTNVKKKLYTYFGNQKDSLVYQLKLREITRRSNESLQDFCKRVAITANKAYPSSPNERERSGIFAIVRGCRSDMVKHAALTNTFKPDTIDKAVQLIWEMENRSKVYQMDLERKDGAIVFDEIDEQQSSTHSPSDDLKWKSSSQRNFDSSNSSPTRNREISRSYSRRNSENNVSPKYTCGCYTCGDHNHFVKDCPHNKSRSPSPRKVQFEKDADRKTLDKD